VGARELDLFARHHETGAPIPEEIFRKMTAAKNFSLGLRDDAAGGVCQDGSAHALAHGGICRRGGCRAARARAVADCLVPTQPPVPTIVKRFTHIFADPSACGAYYSYKWAEVLDADAFTRFQARGIFSAKVGAEFVEKILSRGNSADPRNCIGHSWVGK